MGRLRVSDAYLSGAIRFCCVHCGEWLHCRGVHSHEGAFFWCDKDRVEYNLKGGIYMRHIPLANPKPETHGCLYDCHECTCP